MPLSRLSPDKTEIYRRTTDADFDWMAEWSQACGISNPILAFRMARDWFSPKKDFEALAARVEELRDKYQPLEDSDFDSIAARNFDQTDVVDAMGEETSSFNRRHTKRFMKEGGKLQMFPARNGHFSRLLTDGRGAENDDGSTPLATPVVTTEEEVPSETA